MRTAYASRAAFVLLLAIPASASAQRYSVNRVDGEVVATSFELSNNPSPINTEFYVSLPLVYDSFDNTYGTNGPKLREIATTALDRHDEMRFKWHKKVNGEFFSNSCATAAADLYENASDHGDLGGGWEIRQLGTLGITTTSFNDVVDTYKTVVNFYKGEAFPNQVDFSNPESYGHSLSIVKSPTGEYFSVDNWNNQVTVEQLYPIDEDARFFSTDPDETETLSAGYRLASPVGDNGRPWGEKSEFKLTPEERKQRLREDGERKRRRFRSEPPPTSDDTPVRAVTSFDPNDKTGLIGSGDQRYVTPNNRFRYTIRFENFATATAPAQEVVVRDTLDRAVFDLSTLELGEITFGDTRVAVPPGRQAFSARVRYNDRLDVVVTAALVPTTGVVTWRFATVDRATGELPPDPFDGFLPPNKTAPEGEGSVSLHLAAKPDLPDGTEVSNEARIFFDLNEPIDTPAWVNVIDRSAPVSSVTALQPMQEDSLFIVEWAGADEGAGVAHYDVYVSTDGGEFFPWQTGVPLTSGVFVGRPGRSYAFYSIARDVLGHTEGAKQSAEASTSVQVDRSSRPEPLTSLELASPFPNPVRQSAVLRVGVPTSQDVRVAVFDVRGRQVAQVHDGPLSAGWHALEWRAGALAAGVYVVRLEADGEVRTQRLTVVR